MKTLAAGWRELARILRRQIWRLRLIFERRKLERLESALGLLGWQQADYDLETQEHVSRLTNYEREQAGLTNESAAFGLQIVAIEERRGDAQREFGEAHAEALEREQPAAADLEALEKLLNLQRKRQKEYESRVALLDRELAAAEERYRELVVPQMPTPQEQAQLLQARKLLLALPQERAEWAAKANRCSSEIKAMETLRTDLRAAQLEFDKRDAELAGEIAALQRSKRKVEQQIEAVEKAKTDPYREIGRALADHRIAPLNQPEALEMVLARRARIAALENAILASVAEGAPVLRVLPSSANGQSLSGHE